MAAGIQAGRLAERHDRERVVDVEPPGEPEAELGAPDGAT